MRHELRADPRNQKQRQAEDDEADGDGQPGIRHAGIETALVDVANGFEDHVPAFADAAMESPVAKHGHDRQRQEQSSYESEDHRIGHRLEESAGRSRQGVDRKKGSDDDGDGVEDRTVDLGGGLHNDLYRGQRVAFLPIDRHPPEDVLDHDHGRVDEDAEVDGADRQQVGGDMLQVETDEGEHQRQRDGRGDDQSGAEIVEEEDEDDDDEEHASEQVFLDGPGREGDEVAPVVEGMDLDIFRQDGVVQLFGLLLDPVENDLGLLSAPHEDYSLHGLVAFVVPELAEARRLADHDLPNVLHQHRRAVVHSEYNVADVLDGYEPSEAADVVELSALRVEAAACVAVISAQ